MKSCIYFGSVSHMPVYSQIPQNLHFLRHSCLSDSLCCFFCLSYFLTPCCLLFLRPSGTWPFLLALVLARVFKQSLLDPLTAGPTALTVKVGNTFLPSACLHPSLCKKKKKKKKRNLIVSNIITTRWRMVNEPCLVAGCSWVMEARDLPSQEQGQSFVIPG